MMLPLLTTGVFYARHVASGAFDGSNATFTVADPHADLSVSITAGPDPAIVGQTVTYNVLVTNNGPNDASGLVMTHSLLGSATSFVSVNQPGICSELDDVTTCTIGTLMSGLSFPEIEVVVTADEDGIIIGAADVSASEPDSDPLNNTVQVEIEVANSGDIIFLDGFRVRRYFSLGLESAGKTV